MLQKRITGAKNQRAMERLFTFWRKYAELTEEGKSYIIHHSVVLPFADNDIFAHHDEHKHYWCFIPEGLVAAYCRQGDGDSKIAWIAGPLDYFTGTRHPFTDKHDMVDIVCLQAGRLVMIPNSELIYAQQHFADVGELLQVLKQRKISQQDILLEIMRQKNMEQRCMTFFERCSAIALALSREQCCAFLQVSHSTYNRAKRKFLNQKP